MNDFMKNLVGEKSEIVTRIEDCIHDWGQCSRIHKNLACFENAEQFPTWLGNPGSNIQERFTM